MRWHSGQAGARDAQVHARERAWVSLPLSSLCTSLYVSVRLCTSHLSVSLFLCVCVPMAHPVCAVGQAYGTHAHSAGACACVCMYVVCVCARVCGCVDVRMCACVRAHVRVRGGGGHHLNSAPRRVVRVRLQPSESILYSSM